MENNTTAPESGTPAPIGADAVQQTTPAAQNEPTAFDLDENSLIRIKGQEKPVKFGEYGKSFQSQFTKASQRAAQLERELQAEREAKLKYEQQLKSGTPQQKEDPLADIRGKSYLTGEDTAAIVENLTGEIKQRDQILVAMAQKFQEMEKRLGVVYGNHTNQTFDSKVSKWVADAGYDVQAPGIKDLAQEIYLAYEGNDLDQEFPRIFTERMSQLEQFFEARKRQAVERNRRMPFVPGRGGAASPSKPLEFAGNASAREITEQMWPLMRESGT
jgi:hypothetical protein